VQKRATYFAQLQIVFHLQYSIQGGQKTLVHLSYAL